MKILVPSAPLKELQGKFGSAPERVVVAAMARLLRSSEDVIMTVGAGQDNVRERGSPDARNTL